MSRSTEYLRAISSRTNYVSYYKLGLIADYVERLEKTLKRIAAQQATHGTMTIREASGEAREALRGDLT